jgi:hypothetical protein
MPHHHNDSCFQVLNGVLNAAQCACLYHISRNPNDKEISRPLVNFRWRTLSEQPKTTAKRFWLRVCAHRSTAEKSVGSLRSLKKEHSQF